jgi:histidyl-tRNA synthetase
LALILGSDEVANEVVAVKFLREEQAQQIIPLTEIVNFLRNSV